MALQGQTVDVPIVSLDQHSPTSSGPLGRLRALVNGVVKKISGGKDGVTALRVEKRDGFTRLPTAVRDPATGAISSKTLSTASLLSSYRNQLIAVFLASPFILSEAAGCWEAPTYMLPTQVLRERGAYLGNAVLKSTDSARIGSRTMTAWSETSTTVGLNRISYMVTDDDGTIIRQPVGLVSTATARIKVATDGVQFWLVFTNGIGALQANAFDASGQVLGSSTTGLTAGSFYDVTADPSQLPNGIFTAQHDPVAGTLFTRFRWTGAAVTSVDTTQAAFLVPTGRLAFLRNDTGDGNLYLATQDGSGATRDYHVWQVTAPGAGTFGVGHDYQVALNVSLPAAFQMTGFVAPTGPKDVTLALSYLDPTPTPQLNYTEIRTCTFAGVSVLQDTRKSLTLVSRPFVLSGSYYAVAYYRSNPLATTTGSTGQAPYNQPEPLPAQSTYHLISLSSPYQTCGRWQWGTAYADWADTATTTYYLALATPTVAPDGGVHVPLAYRASSQTATTLVGDVLNPVRSIADVVGINDTSFGPDSGQAVQCATEILLPGPEAVSYTGATFAEHGIGAVPEVTAITQSAAGGGLLFPLSPYQYILVWEWTDNAGQRVRGPAGPPIDIVLTAGNQTITLTGLHNHVTKKNNMSLGVYRTTISGGRTQSARHYKVSGSLAGATALGPVVYNDDTLNTWSFVDQMADVVAANNEVLYRDSGLQNRFPAPPFSVGVEAFSRAFVVGPDNAIWFSGEKTEGDAYWFTPAQRIPLPTFEKVRAMRVLDQQIIVLCESSDAFSIPSAPFPDATGAGQFPIVRPLPFSNGCTGFAETISSGVMYSSPQGGLWLVTRDLQNQYVSGPVEDSLATGAVIGVASDDKQRIAFSNTAGLMMVYDQVTGVWSTWAATQPQAVAGCMTVHKGRLAFVDGAGNVWRQTISLTYDYDGAQHPIVTTVALAFLHLGGIRSYKRLWQTQMQGEYRGDHDLTVTAWVDDNLTTPAATRTFTPGASTPYLYELCATEATELCSSIAYSFVDSFPRGASAGFALEVLSFYVGLEKGLGRLPAAQQIKTT